MKLFMKTAKRAILLILILISFSAIEAKKGYKQFQNKNNDKLEWWKEARFGMFIHWGLYAVPAGMYNNKIVEGAAEWIMNDGDIPANEYEKFANDFNPANFNAYEWVKCAKDAGMKYIVITSKHHDGFCLWDSKVTSYDLLDGTNYKVDIIKELADECGRQGLKFGIYYSIMDWHNPDAKGERFPLYFNYYLLPQIKELLTNYGEINVLWFDGEWIEEWNDEYGEKLYNFITELQPNTIINNRVGKSRYDEFSKVPGDYETPEQEIPASLIKDKNWETCMTMNDTWGFKASDSNWKSTEEIISMLVDVVSKGGNYLLNVGPTAGGIIPDTSVVILKEIGEWLTVHGETIYSSKPYRKIKDDDSIKYISSNDNKYVYVILEDYNEDVLELKDINILQGSEIFMLGTDSPLNYFIDGDKLEIKIPQFPEQQKNIKSTNTIKVIKIKQAPAASEPIIQATKISNTHVLINITGEDAETIIRYSLTGEEVDESSTIYTSPIKIDRTAIINAKSFKENFYSSMSTLLIADIPDSNRNGILYKYYEGENWLKLPEFDKINSIDSGKVYTFDIKNIKKREDQFAVLFQTYLKIPLSGNYKFFAISDDGAKLIIDGNVILDNDGSHSKIMKHGSVFLNKGFHKVELQYFDDCEGEYLELSFESGKIPLQKIPGSLLFIEKQ